MRGISSLNGPLHVIMDVGSDAIKAIIVQGRIRNELTLRPIKKLVAPISALRRTDPSNPNSVGWIAAKLHELIFGIVKEMGRIPKSFLIGVGTGFTQNSLAEWRVSIPPRQQSLSQREIEQYFRNLFKSRQKSGRTSMAYPVGLSLNGYAATLADTTNTRVSELGFTTLFLSFPEEVGAKFSQLSQSFGGLPMEYVPFMVAYRDVLVGSLKTPSAFLIDVGGDETTLILIREGKFIYTTSFLSGGHQIVSRLARDQSLSFEEAEDLKRQYTQGLLPDSRKATVQRSILEGVQEWKQSFEKTLMEFYDHGPIPGLLFLTGGGAYLPDLMQTIKNGDWIKNYSYAETPEVRRLEGRSVFQGNSLNGTLGGTEEAGLAALLYYALHHEPIF